MFIPPLVLIAGGTLLVFLAALRALPLQAWRWAAAALAVVAAALLLAATVGTEADAPVDGWIPVHDLTLPISFLANDAGMFLGLALTVVALSSFLSSEQMLGETVEPTWAYLLMATGGGLLTLLPANRLTLALSWALLDGLLALALFRSPPVSPAGRKIAVRNLGSGLISNLLLWGAMLPAQAAAPTFEIATPVTSGSSILLILAAAVRLAPYPLHALGALGETDGDEAATDDPAANPEPSAGLVTILHLISAASGVWLLAQISGWDGLSPLAFQSISALLLTGLVMAGVLAWLSKTPRETVRWTLSGQAAVIILAALWATPEAALAGGMILVLTGGLLASYVAQDTTTLENRIATGVALVAMAGLPATCGGDSLLPLYASWLANAGGLHLFLAAGAMLLLLGAAGQLLLVGQAQPESQLGRILRGVGLGLPAAALWLRSGSLLPKETQPVLWLALLVPIAGGAVLTWGSDTVRPLVLGLTPRLHPALTLGWLTKRLRWAGDQVGAGLNTLHLVLEGEGALFWVFIALTLGWLLLSG